MYGLATKSNKTFITVCIQPLVVNDRHMKLLVLKITVNPHFYHSDLKIHRNLPIFFFSTVKYE